MLEGLKKCDEDLLDVPSYSELFGEVILERKRKLESKRRHFFSHKSGTAMAVPVSEDSVTPPGSVTPGVTGNSIARKY